MLRKFCRQHSLHPPRLTQSITKAHAINPCLATTHPTLYKPLWQYFLQISKPMLTHLKSLNTPISSIIDLETHSCYDSLVWLHTIRNENKNSKLHPAMGPLRVLHFKGSQLSSAISQFLLLAFHLALNVALQPNQAVNTTVMSIGNSVLPNSKVRSRC
jgi:hypothetical protein